MAQGAAGRLHWPAVFAGLLASALVFPVLLLVFLIGSGEVPTAAAQVEGMLVVLGISVLVTFLHALLLGLPAFLLLRRFGWLSARTLSVAGFVAGALLVGMAGWPWRGGAPGSSYSTSWHGRFVEMQRDGVPTLYGWLSWLESVAVFGLVGIASALAFWYGWRYFQRQADARRQRGFLPRQPGHPAQ
ncbi:hypothetical protein [Pseudoxanthomonas suwonensis]|uniref:hypothetical protein n=1 Tax=Pseudoxanthomonas suwonensis TaxID=314722 RepID=UPI001185DCEC|nr:hypothetical protein [Pseudoxanthomonas suwonensis]